MTLKVHGVQPDPAASTSAADVKRNRRIVFWTRLRRTVDTLKWCALCAVVFIALPFLGDVPVVESIFADLGTFETALAVMAIGAAAWSLVFVTGMLVEGAATRYEPDCREHRRDGGSGPLLRAIERNFTTPASRVQSFLAVGLAVFPVALVLDRGAEGAFLGGALGAVALYVLVQVFSAPVRLAMPGAPSRNDGLPRRIELAFEKLMAALVFPVALAKLVRKASSALLARTPLSDMLDADDGRLAPAHFSATCAFFSTLGIIAFTALAFPPPYDSTGADLPTAALVFVLFASIIWFWGALEYHLARVGTPPALVALIVFAAGYRLFGDTDHEFEAQLGPAGLSPIAGVEAAGEENLVVVCGAGGGILAAGWFALSLDRLAERRPQIHDEIGLLSTVSGSSVGASFYLHQRRADAASGSGHGLEHAATRASLDAVAYGLVFNDFANLLSLGATSSLFVDRGHLLEEQWEATAVEVLGSAGGAGPLRLAGLADSIRSGDLPVPVFNSTALETGRRVQITPIAYPGASEADGGGRKRSWTLGEYLGGDPAESADLSIWTAARLSATFPYVTPAARWRPPAGVTPPGTGLRGGHHMIDGGYAENYGIASALEWLEVVLRERETGGLGGLRRVAILQLNAFPASTPGAAEPQSGFAAALLGPVVGITQVRSGVAGSRNSVELERFLENWRALLAGKVRLEYFVIQPQEGEEGPLSWRLTKRHIEDMRARWDEPAVEATVESLVAFLEGRAD